jgi:hypothetical protein
MVVRVEAGHECQRETVVKQLITRPHIDLQRC